MLLIPPDLDETTDAKDRAAAGDGTPVIPSEVLPPLPAPTDPEEFKRWFAQGFSNIFRALTPGAPSRRIQ